MNCIFNYSNVLLKNDIFLCIYCPCITSLPPHFIVKITALSAIAGSRLLNSPPSVSYKAKRFCNLHNLCNPAKRQFSINVAVFEPSNS